jgi:radical SAM superfamily enzyme YgiQ (UPF0313 family)
VNDEVLVIAPFRRPTFRKAISAWYPTEEPWDSPPLVVAGALEATGLTVRYLALQNLLDAFDPDEDLPALHGLLEDHDPRVVVFASDSFIASRSTATLPGVRAVCEVLAGRRALPYFGLVGRMATTVGGRLFGLVGALDFVVVGEPELVVGEIVSDLIDRGIHALESHDGVITREDPTRSVQPHFARELDLVPLPAFHLLEPSLREFERQRDRGRAPVPFSLRTSAGCRFQCRFCAGVPHWRSYRHKTAERIAAEVDGLSSAVGVRGRLSFLEDEVFTLDATHVESVTPELRERTIVLDGVYTHSSMLTPAIAAQLAPVTKAVYLGMDNVDDGALRRMGKGQTSDMIFRAVSVAREAGLGVHLEWIIGSPEDDVDSVITTLNAIYNLLATRSVQTINTYVFCAHPGTAYGTDPAAHGITIVDDFDHMQESGGYPAQDVPGLTRNQVYVAYLMSQIVIGEALGARRSPRSASRVRGPSRSELRRLFARVSAAT